RVRVKRDMIAGAVPFEVEEPVRKNTVGHEPFPEGERHGPEIFADYEDLVAPALEGEEVHQVALVVFHVEAVCGPGPGGYPEEPPKLHYVIEAERAAVLAV